MAKVKCPSIDFSFTSSICLSALRGFSLRGCFNFGGCFKSSDVENLQEVEPKSLSNSSHVDDDSTTSFTPILLEPENFFQLTQNLENQNPEPIWIKSVSVSLPQGNDPIDDSHSAPTLLEPKSSFQRLFQPTLLNNQNLGPILIESVRVNLPQDNDLSNEPDKNIPQSLTTYNPPVRINEENNGQFIEIKSISVSELMLPSQADARDYVPILLTPMLQVNDEDLSNNLKSVTEGIIYTQIDLSSFVGCDAFQMPRNEKHYDDSQLPRVLRVNRIETPPKPVLDKVSHDQAGDEYSFDETSDDGMPSIKEGGDIYCGGGKSRMGIFRRAVADNMLTEISDGELEEYLVAHIEGQAKYLENKISPSGGVIDDWSEMFSLVNLEKFFGNSSEKVSLHEFFEKLSNFVNEIKEKVVPSPAPASARVDTDNQCKGKY